MILAKTKYRSNTGKTYLHRLFIQILTFLATWDWLVLQSLSLGLVFLLAFSYHLGIQVKDRPIACVLGSISIKVIPNVLALWTPKVFVSASGLSCFVNAPQMSQWEETLPNKYFCKHSFRPLLHSEALHFNLWEEKLCWTVLSFSPSNPILVPIATVVVCSRKC